MHVFTRLITLQTQECAAVVGTWCPKWKHTKCLYPGTAWRSPWRCRSTARWGWDLSGSYRWTRRSEPQTCRLHSEYPDLQITRIPEWPTVFLFLAVSASLRVCVRACTFVVDISRDLDVTQLCVHRQFIEVFILLQREFSSQRQWIPVLIHGVDQHGVIVVKLGRTAPDGHFIDYKMLIMIPHLKRERYDYQQYDVDMTADTTKYYMYVSG